LGFVVADAFIPAPREYKGAEMTVRRTYSTPLGNMVCDVIPKMKVRKEV
jgi:hypothetical protein